MAAPLPAPDEVNLAKSSAALAAGSVGPWEPGGISPFQMNAGRQLAASEARPYDAYGAAVL